MISTIKKRDGRVVPFDSGKIESAILRAFAASGSQKGADSAQQIAAQVIEELEKNEAIPASPSVEEVQDTVERVLIEKGFVRTATRQGYYPRPDGSRASALVMMRDLG